jgi:hypothetical protein
MQSRRSTGAVDQTRDDDERREVTKEQEAVEN